MPATISANTAESAAGRSVLKGVAAGALVAPADCGVKFSTRRGIGSDIGVELPEDIVATVEEDC